MAQMLLVGSHIFGAILTKYISHFALSYLHQIDLNGFFLPTSHSAIAEKLSHFVLPILYASLCVHLYNFHLYL